jgi:hypothetical protein
MWKEKLDRWRACALGPSLDRSIKEEHDNNNKNINSQRIIHVINGLLATFPSSLLVSCSAFDLL